MKILKTTFSKADRKNYRIAEHSSLRRLRAPCEAPSNAGGPGDFGWRCLSPAGASLASRPARRVAQGSRRSRPRSLGRLFFGYFLLAKQKKVCPPVNGGNQRKNSENPTTAGQKAAAVGQNRIDPTPPPPIKTDPSRRRANPVAQPAPSIRPQRPHLPPANLIQTFPQLVDIRLAP